MEWILAFLIEYNSIGCGFKPLPPFGCSSKAICICDADRNCEWIFTDCEY